MASTLHLYDTLQRKLVAFVPRDPARITFYTCGPTVYDDAHIGNFRSFLAADVLRRFLESPLCRLANHGAGRSKTPAAPEHGLQSRATPEPGSDSRATNRTVIHVMNITDVGHMTDDAAADGAGEDKMAAAARRLLDAKKSGKLPPGAADIDPTDQLAIARFYEARFKEDAIALGLKVAIDAGAARGGDPTLMPRATDAVPGMIAVIKRLIAQHNHKGQPYAYAVGPAGTQTVYFCVQSFPPYGSLSGNTLDALRSGEGGRIQESHQAEKKHPADFLLWKSDPTHAMRWKSPWGEGYPGWHIECSAMSAARLCSPHALTGEGERTLSPDQLAAFIVDDAQPIIDLHSGGEDNIFPHHECEIAQSCCAFNATPGAGDLARGLYAAHWFHPRFLMVEGAKMSKSKGNFHTPRDLIAKGHEPAAIRLELIKTHYRSNANFTEQGLKDSARMVERWRRVTDAPHHDDPDGDEVSSSEARRVVRRSVAEELHNDLNIAGALGALNGWLGAITGAPTSHDAALLRDFDSILGVLSLPRPAAASTSLGLFAPGLTADPAVIALLEQRAAARVAKDFKQSDTIRDQLTALGYAIQDAPNGKVEVRRA